MQAVPVRSVSGSAGLAHNIQWTAVSANRSTKMERMTAREKVLADSFQLSNIFEHLDLNSVKNVRLVTKGYAKHVSVV